MNARLASKLYHLRLNFVDTDLQPSIGQGLKTKKKNKKNIKNKFSRKKTSYSFK